MKTSKFIQRTKEVAYIVAMSFVIGFIVFIIFALACNCFEQLFTMSEMFVCATGLGIGSAVAFVLEKFCLDGFKKY